MISIVRRAQLDDLPLLIDLMREFYAESKFSLNRTWARESFSALLSDDSRGGIWIASHDEQPAGYVVMTVRFTMECGGLDAFIEDLFVRPRYRGAGFGKSLLNQVFAECARRRVCAVHVEVDPDSAAAQALYARYGLRDTGRQLLSLKLANGPKVA